MPNRSDWTAGAKVTFVVSGTLTGDEVSIGCQHVNVADLVKVASALTKGPAGITATVTGTITPDDLVTFEGSTRSFTVSQVREVARNVQITAPSEPELTEADLYPGLILTDTPEGYTGADYGYWMVGAPLARDPEGYPLPIFRIRGSNLSDRTSWDRLPYWQNIARGQRRRLRKATGAFDTKDPRGEAKSYRGFTVGTKVRHEVYGDGVVVERPQDSAFRSTTDVPVRFAGRYSSGGAYGNGVYTTSAEELTRL